MEGFAVKLWAAICSFFGFGSKPKSFKQEYDELEQWLNSQEYFDQCSQRAYQAVQNRDSLNPGQVHPHEANIVTDCIKVDSALSRYQNAFLTEQFGDARYLTEMLHSGITTQLSEASAAGVAAAVSSEVARKAPTAELLLKQHGEASRELHIFKGANGLKREAVEPARSSIFYYMGAFAIAEILANVIFLREAFEPAKGLLIAVMVALLNLVGAAWFGYQYREKNHSDPIRARQGRRNALYAAAVVIFANAVIAGFRWHSAQTADISFYLESILLFAVGSALGYAAFHKAYRLDDPFPGFGPLSRKVASLDEQLIQLREAHADYCRDIKTRSLEAHASLEKRLERAYQDLGSKLPEMRRAIEVWSRQRNSLNQRCKTLQTAFKAIVTANVGGDFGYPGDITALPSDHILDSFKEEIDSFEEERGRLDRRVDELRGQVQKSRDLLEQWFKSDEANVLFGWPK
jgi:hypothetical protein